MALLASPFSLVMSAKSILHSWHNVAYLFLLFNYSIMSDLLWPHGLQHARLPSPSLSPRVCSNLCSLSWWCHPTISSSVTPISLCLQSFAVSFPMSQFFEADGQSIRASAPVLPVNIQGWFPLGLSGLNSPLQYSCLENPRDRGAWWAAVYVVA